MAIERDISKRLDEIIPPASSTEAEQPMLADEAAQIANPLAPQEPEEGVQVAGLVSGLATAGKAMRAARRVQKEAPRAAVLYDQRATGQTIIPPKGKVETDAGLTDQQVVDKGVNELLQTPSPPDVPGITPTPAPPGTGVVPPVRIEQDVIYVEPASVTTLEKLKAAITGAPTSGKPPNVRPNLDAISAEDDVKKLIYATTEVYKQWVDTQRQAGRTLDDIAQDALKMGDDAALRALIKRKPGDRPFLDFESLAARMAVLNLQQATKQLVQQAMTSGDPRTMISALKAMTFEGYVQSAQLGNMAETGRALAVGRLVVSPDKSRVANLQKTVEQLGIDDPARFADIDNPAQIIRDLGGMEMMRNAFKAYMALPNDSVRGVYSKHLARATLDSAAEIYQSALLSNPVTQGFNIVGTPIHALTLIAERGAAAVFTGDVARLNGVFAGLRAIPRYTRQALSAAAKGFMTEQASDMGSKFDAGSRLATKAENFGVAPDTYLGKGIDLLGQGFRLFGFRVLTTVDEGYKAMLRGMELEMMAAEAQSRAFMAKIADGATEAEAMEHSSAVYMRVLESPTSFDEAAEFARVVAFQDELPGKILKGIEPIIQHPLQRLFGPLQFYKTPTQVVLRIQERTPLAVLMPRFWKAVTNPANPGDRSLALAKLSMASLVAGAYMTIGADDDSTILTGYGPTNPAERRRWLEKHQPYSIGEKQEDGSYRWKSFERYDPFSGVLAFWVDARDTMLKDDDPDSRENIALDVSLATMRYMTEAQPSIQTLAELSNTIGPSYEGETDKMERIMQIFAKHAADVGLTTGQAVVTGGLMPQSLTANLQRYLDPFKKSTVPSEQYDYLNIPGFRTNLRSGYEALAKARARIPYFADSAYQETNDWYEPVKIGTGDFRAFLPMRIIEKRFNGINAELEKIKGALPRISPSMNESMIKLNAQQFNRYKELVNYPNRSPFFANELFGKNYSDMTPEEKKIFKQHPNRADRMLVEIASPFYNIGYDEAGNEVESTNQAKLEYLRAVHTEYTSQAKRLMLLEFPELQELVNQRDAFKAQQNRLPRNLPLSDETKRSIKYNQ